MSAKPASRPSAVTLACVFVGVSSALLLVNIGTLLSDWGSIEIQEQVGGLLEEPPLSETAITLGQAMSWLRVALMVGAVLAVAGVVLSVFTARGDRGSRIALTVLCAGGAVMFIAGGLVGLLPAAVALACAFTLWSSDSRRWFDVVNGRTPVAELADGRRDPFADRSALASGDASASAAPPATTLHPAAGASAQAATAAPAASGRRPRSVSLAAGLALAFSAMTALLGALALLFSTAGEAVYRRSLEESPFASDMMRTAGVTVDDMLSLMTLAGAAWLLMGVVGAVAAVAALARSNPGRHLLRVMSVLTVGVSVLFLPVGLLTGGIAVLTLIQLQRADAREWFAARP